MCKKVRRGDLWVDGRHLPFAALEISHTYCPVCAEAARAMLHRALRVMDETSRRAI